MVMQKQTSMLAKQLGAKLTQAHAQHKDTPVEVGNVRLPEGIENGVAQLVDCRFGTYKDGANAGKTFWMAQGVMVEPKTLNGTTVEGRRTSMGPIPLCDTPQAQGRKKTFADHYADFLNELKKLGVDLSQTDAKTPEQVEAFLVSTVDALKATANPDQQHIYFGVRTWKGKATTAFPNPRVNEEWNGVVVYDSTADPSSGVDDGSAPSTDMGPEPFTEPPQEEPSADATVDLAALAETADADPNGETDDGKVAIAAINEMALAAGHSPEAVQACASWSEVALLAGTPPQETTPAATAPPTKGQVVNYRARDAKGAVLIGKDKKPIAVAACEVTSVDAKAETVTLKNTTGAKGAVIGVDKKLLKVKWSDLE